MATNGGALTRGQRIFRDELSRQTGLNRRFIGAWLLAEQNGSAAKGYENRGYNNWLNIARTDSGDRGGSHGKYWADPVTAARITAQWMRGQGPLARDYGAPAPGIRRILSAKGVDAQIHALATSGWASSGYNGGNTLRQLLGLKQGEAPAGQRTTTSSKSYGLQPAAPSGPLKTPDGRTAEQEAVLQALMAHRGPKYAVKLLPGIREQLEAQQPQNPTRPKSVAAKAGQAVSPPTTSGKVSVASTANRAGVPLSSGLINFVNSMTQWAGNLSIGTGSNHSKMTSSGNVSDHWTGNGADLPATGKRGDTIAYAALRAAGVAEKDARRMARNGGVFNINHGGYRIQILWKTNVGGNHFNHVHVGVRKL